MQQIQLLQVSLEGLERVSSVVEWRGLIRVNQVDGKSTVFHQESIAQFNLVRVSCRSIFARV